MYTGNNHSPLLRNGQVIYVQQYVQSIREHVSVVHVHKKNDENIHYKDFASQASRLTCSTFTTVGTNKKYNVYPVTLCMCHVVKFVFTSTQ